MQYVSSVFSTNWWTDNVALYGSTTVSDTFGDGTTEYVFMILSGYSSRIFEMSNVPMPDPVPPPSEWVSWKPWRQSHDSASLRTCQHERESKTNRFVLVCVCGLLLLLFASIAASGSKCKRFDCVTYHIQYWIDQLSTFGVMSFCPVVTGARLTEYEIVRTEDLSEWSGTNRIHGAWFQIDQNGTWYVFAARCFIVVNVDTF